MALDERTTGIILRTRPLTETSLIVHWLTPDLGRMATVAKGARRAKSPFRGKLDLFYAADFGFVRSRRSELHTLREINIRDVHPMLRRELGYVQQASYCAALIEQVTETETPLPEIFALLSGFLSQLPNRPPMGRSVFAFELKLLSELGLVPDPADIKVSEGTKQIMRRLVELDWPGLAPITLSDSQHNELKQFLHGYLIYHVDKIPRDRERAIAPG